ncbi:MAG: ABC transporter ATP-binding protein [Kiritimatiellae bacterium]|jgi:lipoprotein-releasing system ATP-binding protein|nr:ABC transporter ATP-binding protein [Kiritimatiellia bacterium]
MIDAQTTTPILEVKNLNRSYQMGATALTVLGNVSLQVFAGETVAIIGASGAGKSTLLHIIGGLDQPTGGAVRLHGRDIYAMSGRQRTVLRARSIGFVFQFYHLLPELDVLENVMLPAMNSSLGLFGFAGRPASLDKPGSMALKLLRSVGLAERSGHLPAELSGGEQQRVAVARALVNEPELVLADEPTGNLDSVTGAQVLNVLFGLVGDKRRTLLLVTHNAEVAARCSRVLKLKDGRLDAA